MRGVEALSKRQSDRRIRAEKWQSHIESWKSSGLNGSAYCRREGINYYSFIRWRKRLEAQPLKNDSSLTLVKLDPSKCSPESMKQDFSSHQSPIRFWVNGFCVEVDESFSPATLSLLIETLRRH